MRKIIIENVALMSIQEENMLIRVLNALKSNGSDTIEFERVKEQSNGSDTKEQVLNVKLRKIGAAWSNTRTHTKIYVLEDYTYADLFDLDTKQKVLPKGAYYICGFWGNAMGLSRTQEGYNDFVLPSNELMHFYTEVE